jgi:DNA-binding HxlR family transcriptional regulator
LHFFLPIFYNYLYKSEESLASNQVGKKSRLSMKNNTNSDNEYTTVEKKLTDFENTCVAQQALKTITGKWKISIIKIVAAQCPKRFGILKRDLDHIAQGTLTTVLRELEQDGILAREAFAEIPPRVEYKLTAKGIKLLPILIELEQWYQTE